MIGIPQGIYDELTDTDYHGDGESLSSSGARKLLDCPAKFDHNRRAARVEKSEFDLGHVFHTRVLGIGAPSGIVMDTVKVPITVPATDYRTASAREDRDAITAAGRIPILAKDVKGDVPEGHEVVTRIDFTDKVVEASSYISGAAKASRDAIRQSGAVPLLRSESDDVDGMVASVKAHPDAAALLSEGIPERSLFWHDQDAGVMLRARPDWTRVLPDGRLLLIDLKSSVSADPREFASSAAKWAYSFQEAFYRHVHAGLGLEVAEFLFIVTEKQAPYLTSVIRIDSDDIAAEYPRIEQAKQLYRECTASGIWRGYPTGINDISLPQWYRKAIA